MFNITAMRPSTALLLLIVAFIVVSVSSKRIHRKGKPKQDKPGKKEESDKKKYVKKDETEEEEESEDEDSKDSDEEESDDEGSEEYTEEESEEEEEDGGTASDKEEDKAISLIKSEEFKVERREDLQGKGIFYSLDDIKEYLKRSQFKGDHEVAELLRRFNVSEVQVQEKLETYHHKPLHPFYVVEGVNPDARRQIAQTLAHRLKGLYIVNQPRVSLGPIPKFEGAKKVYYALSKYAIANKVLMSLFHSPVVIESYWTEHTSFIMSKLWNKANKLPSPESTVYRFPEDLLNPNVTFAIYNSPPPRIGKQPSKKYLQEQRDIFNAARDLVKKQKLSAVWVNDGRVIAKKEQTGRTTRIRDLAELQHLAAPVASATNSADPAQKKAHPPTQMTT